MAMIPYTENSKFNYKIFNEDSILSPTHLQNNTVDLFFTDPPYFTTSIEWDVQWKSNEEYYAWCRVWIKNMYDQLKSTGSAYVCCQWQHSGMYQAMLQEAGFNVLNRITWKRDKGRGSSVNWKQMHEDIWFVTKGKKYTFNVDQVMVKKKVIAPYKDEQGNPKDWWIDDETGEKVRLTHPGNLWETFSIPFWSSKEVRSYAKTKRTPDNKFEKHNTQKPKDLVKKCITSSNVGDLVVDYFGGSGTTLIASKELDRNCIIFEKNPTYFEVMKTRLLYEINTSDENRKKSKTIQMANPDLLELDQ
jgi:site-specific DNA-methyltransferase (adenine-specific)